MIQWAKFVPKAKMIGSKVKGVAMKAKAKMTPSPETVLGARAKMQTALRSGSYKIQAFKQKAKTATMKGVSKGKALASQAKSTGMAGMSKAKAFGIKQKAKFDKLTPTEKTIVGGTAIGLGVGIPVKGAAFYYGAREGAALVEKRKQKKNVKKNRKTS
jgi:hypothetical protein